MGGAAVALELGNELAGSAGTALKRILALGETAPNPIRTSAAASEEQSVAAGQINRSTEEINRIVSEAADTARLPAEALAELTEIGKELGRLVEQLRKG